MEDIKELFNRVGLTPPEDTLGKVSLTAEHDGDYIYLYKDMLIPQYNNLHGVLILYYDKDQANFPDEVISHLQDIYFEYDYDWSIFNPKDFSFWSTFSKGLPIHPIMTRLDGFVNKDFCCKFCPFEKLNVCKDIRACRDCNYQKIALINKYPIKELYTDLVGDTNFYRRFKLTAKRWRQDFSFDDYLNTLKKEIYHVQ